MQTTRLAGREGESIQVAAAPGEYAVDRSYNPGPGMAEEEHASGRQQVGELPGGGRYAAAGGRAAGGAGRQPSLLSAMLRGEASYSH